MQDRELNYFVRMKFIEWLEDLPTLIPDGTVEDYCTDKFLKFYGLTRSEHSYKENKRALIEELKSIIIDIKDNSLNHTGFGNYAPTGHYYTDYIAITLAYYFKGRIDSTMTIDEHKLGDLIYYTKNYMVVAVEKFIDRAAAIKCLYKVGNPYPNDVDFKTLIDSSLHEISTRFYSDAIVVPNQPCYITSLNTDYAVTEDGIIDTIKQDSYGRFVGNYVGVRSTELEYLIHHGMSIRAADDAISSYLNVYNDLLNGNFDTHITLSNIDEHIKIEAYIEFRPGDHVITGEMLGELISCRNDSMHMIVAKVIDDWCKENYADPDKRIPWSYFFGAYTIRDNLIKGLRAGYGPGAPIIAEWKTTNFNNRNVNEFIEHFDHVDRIRDANKIRTSAIHVAAYIKGFDNRDDLDKFVDDYYGPIAYAVSQQINNNEFIYKEGIKAGDLVLKNRNSTKDLVMFSFRLPDEEHLNPIGDVYYKTLLSTIKPVHECRIYFSIEDGAKCKHVTGLISTANLFKNVKDTDPNLIAAMNKFKKDNYDALVDLIDKSIADSIRTQWELQCYACVEKNLTNKSSKDIYFDWKYVIAPIE